MYGLEENSSPRSTISKCFDYLANRTLENIKHQFKSFEAITLFCSVEHIWEYESRFHLIGIPESIWNQFHTTLHYKVTRGFKIRTEKVFPSANHPYIGLIRWAALCVLDGLMDSFKWLFSESHLFYLHNYRLNLFSLHFESIRAGRAAKF